MQQSNQPQVLFAEIPALNGNLGVITLNRPESLNALSLDMLNSMTDKLHSWQNDAQIHAVIIKSSTTKAFCAGGDIKRLYNVGPEHYHKEIEYFRIEYKLSELIHEFPKPYIALLDGIAMGGGLGLSIHGSRVVATERLRLAMPETAIGLYPDAGASHFLSRCPDHLGMYLGLTGNTISVADAIYCGLVDAQIDSAKIQGIIDLLSRQDLSIDPFVKIDKIIADYETTPGPSILEANIATIRRCFSQDSVQSVIDALAQETSSWATEQLAIINTRSPSSLKITHREVTVAATKYISDCLEMEFNLTSNVLQTHDLYEGIRAVLVDKTHDAKWLPARLQDVDDTKIAQMFEIKCTL